MGMGGGVKIDEYAEELYEQQAIQRKKYYIDNKEKFKIYQKEYYQKHPEKFHESSLRQLKKCALPFRLSINQYRYGLMSWTKTVRKLLGDYCAICGSTDMLNSHHIFPKSLFPELSLNINNGIPLCKEHHLEVHRLNPMVAQ
jgi:predicted restriction endonuclease